jgi:uncharacterized protein involved in exopolysaccharide biosynthesis
VLWGARKFIVLVTIACTVLAVIVSLVWPKTYRAEAVIMPLGGQKSGGGLSAAVSQMGLGGLLGGLGGATSNSTQIMAILKSRTLAERVIQRYDLLPLLYEGDWDPATSRWIDAQNPPNLEDAVRRLSLLLETTDDKKNQTIKIAALNRLPEATALIVNGLLTELYKDINENAFTVQKRNRIFIEDQLERNKQDLLEVGKELSSFYATNRVSDSRSQIDVDVKQSMGLLPESDPATAKSLPPSLIGIEIPVMPQDLQEQVDTLRQKIDEAKVVHEVPQQVYLQYLTMRQELMGRMNALLTQQYEMAKIEESKEDLSFQVIDWARVPVKKYWPKRAQIVVTVFVLSGFLSVFYVFFRDYWKKMKEAS